MEYGITAAATLASALLGVAFSLGAVRREQGPARSSALYMLARSLGLTALAAIPVWRHSVGILAAATGVMLLVQAVDGLVHVNRFRRFEDYQRLCAASGFEQLELHRCAHVLHYPDVRSLTHELKALGAHNLNPGRPSGLTGRARMQGLLQAYEAFRQPAGLPATYQVVYGVLRKPQA